MSEHRKFERQRRIIPTESCVVACEETLQQNDAPDAAEKLASVVRQV